MEITIIVAIMLVLLLGLTLLGGLGYKLWRWISCRFLGTAILSKPAKVLETYCPECGNVNINWNIDGNLRCVWGQARDPSGTRRGGDSLVPNHVNCINCGQIYKVW